MATEQERLIFQRGVIEIISIQELTELLNSGRPLRLKMGFDPSRPDIHLGHVVGLRKLRQFQEMGHQVILIVGDWTAQIGDPSGRSATRPMLTPDEVTRNAHTYLDQFFKVVDQEKTQVLWQSEWFGKFGLSDIISLTSRFTVAQFLAREDFSDRYKTGRPIAITELLYPLLQAYDSFATHADVEFGGTDQKFNLLVGRELQQMLGQKPQQCLIMPILPGTDGVQKMSKSLNNYIAVEEPANDMFGKIMSLPDHLIETYFELLTDLSEEELVEVKQSLNSRTVNPIELKKTLGKNIVGQFHSTDAGAQAANYFERVVQRGEIPEHPIEIKVDFSGDPVVLDLIDILVRSNIVKSRSEAKRLYSQGAIEIDGYVANSLQPQIHQETTVKIGKRHWIRFVGTRKPATEL